MDRADRPEPVPRELAQTIVSAAGIDARVVETSLLGQGVKSVVTLIALDQHDDLALKVFTRGEATAREHAAYRLLGDHDLPMPRMLAAAEATEELPYGFTLMTLAPGAALNTKFVSLERDQLLEIYRGIGAFQAALHKHAAPGFAEQVDSSAYVGNAELMRARLGRSLAGFLEHGGNRYLASVADRQFGEHEAALAGCTRPVVCHGDLHPENVRVAQTADGLRFSSAIDLEESFAGDPVMDLVRTIHTCPLPGDDVTAALLDGYGGKPSGFDELFDFYFIFYELELWNFYARGGSRTPLPSIARRIARRSGASRLRIWRSVARRAILPRRDPGAV